MRDFVVRQEGQYDAGTVYDAHLLGFFLGAQHNDGRKDGDAGKQHRSQESNQQKALFLNLVKILALDDNA